MVTRARKETAEIRVLRVASAEFIELATLEMLGQVVSITVESVHTVTDSLSVEIEIVGLPGRSVAAATIRSRPHHHHGPGGTHTPGHLGEQVLLRQHEPRCSS